MASSLACLDPCSCAITKSSYTQNEMFDKADAVFDCIGEAGEERFSLTDLANMLEAKANVSA